MALLLGRLAIIDLHQPRTTLDFAYKAFLVQKIGLLVRVVDWTAHENSVPPWTAECCSRYSVTKTIARIVVLVQQRQKYMRCLVVENCTTVHCEVLCRECCVGIAVGVGVIAWTLWPLSHKPPWLAWHKVKRPYWKWSAGKLLLKAIVLICQLSLPFS